MPDSKSLQSRLGPRVTLGAIILFVLVMAVRLPASDHSARKDAFANLENRLANQAKLHIDSLEAELDALRKDVSFLAATPPIQGIVRAHTSGNNYDAAGESTLKLWQQRLQTIFSAYLQTHPQATQLRYIGVADNGRELLRVRRVNGAIAVVPENQLQPRADRDYFIRTLTRKPGQVVLSEINLHRETGRVQQPHVPTLRASTPVYTGNGKVFGMLVINQNAEPLLRKLQTATQAPLQTYLMNSRGDFLSHPDASKTFGFDLNQAYRWQDSFQLNSRTESSGLQNFSGPHGALEVLTRRLHYDRQAQNRYLSLAVVADAGLIHAAIVQARERAILALLAGYAIAALCLYLIVQAFRKREEAGHKQAELAAIVSQSQDAIIGKTLSGRVSSWNHAAEELFGYDEASAVGQNIDALIVPLERLEEEASLRRKVRAGERTGVLETIRRRKDGSSVDVAISISPIARADGKITGASMIVRDITAQKKAQAHILELNESLEHKVALRTDELEVARQRANLSSQAKGEFLANMSHELRTPMNAVLGMLQLMQHTEMTERQADYMEKTRIAASSLLSIINDILDFSKIEAGKLSLDPQPFIIDRLLCDLSMLLGAVVGDKNVEILFHVDPEVPQHLLGDSLRLKQVLVNLGGNAVKFTEQGEVLIEVAVAEFLNDEVVLEFRVMDTGIGISEAQQQRIFQAFSQAEAGTTRRFGGTGLGLVTSQRLIDMLGGKLRVESELNKGSCFSFTARMRRMEKPDSQTDRPGAELRPELQQLRVLIVDDNPHARQIMAEIAAAQGWACDLAGNGEEALHQIRNSIASGKPYKLAFIDWKMPGMDGWQTSQAIRKLEARKQLPLIVMVTAHAREMLANRMARNEDLIDGFLVKPITGSALMDAVAEALGARSMQRMARKPERQDNRQRLKDMRILIVEDNPTNQQVAQRLLEHEGAMVSIASGGLKAIETLGTGKPNFDAVLMDIQMPDLDGYETTRRIRHELELTTLPIIAMTANVMQSDREAALAAGMNEHIGKPFVLNRVVDTLLHFTGRSPAPVATEPTSEAGESCLPPDPPGFEFSTALQRLGNQSDLYARQARRFADQYGAEDQGIRLLLEKGDAEAGARRLHSLKGVAATLGASALAEHCRALEKEVRQGQSLTDMEAALAQLRALLSEASQALETLAGQLVKAVNGADSQSASSGEYAALLEQLQHLLADSNMQAMSVYTELRPLLTEVDEEWLNTLDSAMDNLDFALASAQLQSLDTGKHD